MCRLVSRDFDSDDSSFFGLGSVHINDVFMINAVVFQLVFGPALVSNA
jgi:hypothetical protein